MADPNIVRDWLILLASINGYGLGKEEVEFRLDLLAPALGDEFPVETFTPETLRAVARKHVRYFPGFGEICEVLKPFAEAVRYDRQLRIEYSGRPPAMESQEPYELPPPPEWCFNRKTRNMPGSLTSREVADLARPPIRSPARQIAELLGITLAEAEARLSISPRATANA